MVSKNMKFNLFVKRTIAIKIKRSLEQNLTWKPSLKIIIITEFFNLKTHPGDRISSRLR